MNTWQKSSLLRSKLLVWVFIPYCMTGRGMISKDYDNLSYRHELTQVFAELKINWKWQPVTLENMHIVVAEVAAAKQECIPIVLNYCDGFDEVDSYPGLSVIKLLEANSIIFTGADSIFEYQTISKIRMKQALIEAGVETAPYKDISDRTHIQGVCDRLGVPLIVKPSTSEAGYGLSSQSVVYSDQEIEFQVTQLLKEQGSYQSSRNGIFVERFIDGREFTVFLVGSATRPKSIKPYPPLEFIFHSSLPNFERLKSDKLFESDLEESLCGFLVASPLSKQLTELSKRAYCAVGGNGYGRVDIRMDQASQELFVLEVNANCAISAQPIASVFENCQTSVGTILHLAGIPFAQLISEIITEATVGHESHQLNNSKSFSY